MVPRRNPLIENSYGGTLPDHAHEIFKGGKRRAGEELAIKLPEFVRGKMPVVFQVIKPMSRGPEAEHSASSTTAKMERIGQQLHGRLGNHDRRMPRYERKSHHVIDENKASAGFQRIPEDVQCR